MSGWRIEFTIYAELVAYDHPLATDRPVPPPPCDVEVSVASDPTHRLVLVDWSDLARGRPSHLRLFQVPVSELDDIVVEGSSPRDTTTPPTTVLVTTRHGHFVLRLRGGPDEVRVAGEQLLSLVPR